ncbi:MAG: hypothetical protein RSE12_17090 [Fuscovulum sp.]|nr:MAG: hypothetical protein RSE12_17090 [Fuscovulum sp.]
MPTVDAIFAARAAAYNSRTQYEGYGIGASDLGQDCDRAIFYSLRWASPQEEIDGRKARIFERGDIEERRVLDDLRAIGADVREADPATGKQWRFSLANGFIRGKADGRISGIPDAPKSEHVLEIKSLKASDFRAILKHGLAKAKPMHWHQLHAGMAALGIDRGLYIGTNKDTEEILTERVKLDQDQANRQEARVLSVLDMHYAPGRISDKSDAFACRFCKHKGVCHDGFAARRNCRTCIHWTFTEDGNGHCSRFDEPRKPDQQKRTDCPAHLFLPALVAGEQIDADPDAETITYRLSDGSIWIDGESHHQSKDQ